MLQRKRIRLLFILAVACLTLASLPLRAQREPVLKQINEPHPYYFREMYLPQPTTGPSAVAWTSDSRSVVFSMSGSLWQQKLDSAVAYQVTAGSGYDYQPDCSPEGRWVVYASSTWSRVSHPMAGGSPSFPLRSMDASTFSLGNSAMAS